MKRITAWTSTAIVAASLLVPARSQAAGEAVRQTFEDVPTAAAPAKSRSSAGKYIPWYAIPNKFFFSGSYYTQLNITALRVDHVAENSRCTPKNRIFTISAAFEQPVGTNLFSSRLELPIFSADRFKMSRLAPASVGDYVLYMSNEQMTRSSLQLAISARF